MALSWRTDFPGGNGLLLEADESAERTTLRFAAEPRNCPQAMWFHFRAEGLRQCPVRVVLANPEQTLGGADWSGNCLVVRSGDRPWARTGRGLAVTTPAGRTEWVWKLDVDGDWVEVAHCFPYQPADLEATLKELGGAFAAEFAGLTLKGRHISLVTNRPPAKDIPAVLLTARHHAGEVTGSWVLDGLLRTVAADRRLREKIAWWAVPFVDLDDVVEGSYGKDPWPHDCNRAYGPGGPRRPEATPVVAAARRLKQSASRLFFADLHGPGHAERANYVPARGWHENSPINPIAYEFGQRFQAACPAEIRSPRAFIVPRAGSNDLYAGLPSAEWAHTLGADAVTVEISYQGNATADYTVADYRRLGAALAETIAEWLA